MNEISCEVLYKWYSRPSNALTFEQQGEIMELYFGYGMSEHEIAEKYKISYNVVLKVIDLFFTKPVHGLSIMSKV